ncbi:hypothetical protein TeGR_g6144, partial [Tetraparma gracilis]
PPPPPPPLPRYFGGKSRYIGVYKDSDTACAIYDKVKASLEKIVQEGGLRKGEPPEVIFDRVKKRVKEQFGDVK